MTKPTTFKPSVEFICFYSIQSLERYLISVGADKILFKSKTSNNLTEITRKSLVRHIMNYMKQVYGLSPKSEQYISTSHAVIELFPCLIYKNSQMGGIVSSSSPNSKYISWSRIFFHTFLQDLLFNHTNGGYLSQRFKYERLRVKQLQQKALDQIQEAYEEGNEIIEYDPTEDLNFLKCCVVNDHNMGNLKLAIERTAAHRLNMMKVVEMDLLENFPFFFACPQLVQLIFFI